MSKQTRITKSAKGQACIKCGGPDAYACHYNGTWQQRYGKGRGIRCNDLATAEFCYACDQLFTEGSTNGFDNQYDRDAQFHHFILLTNIRRLERGVIEI